MTIKSHDATSFTISTSKFGEELGSQTFEYGKLAEAQVKWAIRNGFSQAMTDSHASETREEHGSEAAAIAAAKASVAEWIASMLQGHIPSEGVGRARLSPMARALREVVSNWLVSGGMKKAEALKAASDDWQSLVLQAAEKKVASGFNGDPAEMAAKKIETFEAQAKAIVTALASAPGADF